MRISIGMSRGGRLFPELQTLPHLLVAGTTGSGKSVFLRQMLMHLLENEDPSQLRLFLVDCKYEELVLFAKTPFTEAFCSEPGEALQMLRALKDRMERRFRTGERRPVLLLVIDEYADLSPESGEAKNLIAEIQALLLRIFRKGRAAGLHAVIATQRPDAKVIDGGIKNNIPSRLAFAVPDHVNSYIILDRSGAELLSRPGNGLYLQGLELCEVQVPFLTRREARDRIQVVNARWATQAVGRAATSGVVEL